MSASEAQGYSKSEELVHLLTDTSNVFEVTEAYFPKISYSLFLGRQSQ